MYGKPIRFEMITINDERNDGLLLINLANELVVGYY